MGCCSPALAVGVWCVVWGVGCGLLVHHGVFYGVVGWVSQAARTHQQAMALGLTLANVGLLVAIGWMYAPGGFGPFAKPWYHALLGDGLATMDGLLAILLALVVGVLVWARRFVRRHLLGANPGSD